MSLSPMELERRKGYVTATDVAAILGASPYRNARDVYLDKTEPLTRWDGNDATEAGNLLEPVILQWASQQLGEILPAQFLIHSNGINACTLDGRLPTGEPVEAKSHGIVGPADFDAWGDGGDALPDAIILQVNSQMLVTGESKTWVPALIGGRGFLMYVVERHDSLQNMILEESERFWRDHVLTRCPPSEIPHLDTVKRMCRTEGKIVPVPEELAMEYLAAADMASKASKLKETAQAALLASLGDADGASWPGGTFSYRQQTRKSYTVEESTFRVLRHSKLKEQKLSGTSTPAIESGNKLLTGAAL